MAKFDDFYDNLEHKTAISDIYDKLNKQTKDDLEHHPEKEYLEKLLQDFCYITDIYNNYNKLGRKPTTSVVGMNAFLKE